MHMYFSTKVEMIEDFKYELSHFMLVIRRIFLKDIKCRGYLHGLALS